MSDQRLQTDMELSMYGSERVTVGVLAEVAGLSPSRFSPRLRSATPECCPDNICGSCERFDVNNSLQTQL
jgi:hypothetical protein